MHPKKRGQYAFLMVKPDGVRRRLIGEILRRVERTDLELVAQDFFIPSARLAAKHYKQKRNGSSGLSITQAVEYLTSGPVLVSVWRGTSAVRKVRRLVGSQTDPGSCKIGTIRRDFARDSLERARRQKRAVRNTVHSSNDPETALLEISLWFGKRWRGWYAQ